MDIPADEQVRTLTALGFTVEGDQATPPTWRPDVLGEADLVEEIARVASLTKLKAIPLARVDDGVGKPILTPMQKRESAARRRLASAGLNECVTYSFVSTEEAAFFGGGDAAAEAGEPDQFGDVRHAPLAAARPDGGGGAQPGPRLHGSRPVRGRRGVFRRRARRAAHRYPRLCAWARPRPATGLERRGPSISGMRARTPKRRWAQSARRPPG